MSAVIPLFAVRLTPPYLKKKIGSKASRERGRNRVPRFVGHTHSELARRFLLTYRIRLYAAVPRKGSTLPPRWVRSKKSAQSCIILARGFK